MFKQGLQKIAETVKRGHCLCLCETPGETVVAVRAGRLQLEEEDIDHFHTEVLFIPSSYILSCAVLPLDFSQSSLLYLLGPVQPVCLPLQPPATLSLRLGQRSATIVRDVLQERGHHNC